MLIFVILGPPIGLITFAMPFPGPTFKSDNILGLLFFSYLGGFIPAFIAGVFNSSIIIILTLRRREKEIENSTLTMCGGIAGIMAFITISLAINKFSITYGALLIAATCIVPGIICGYLVNGWAYTNLYNSKHRS